MLFLIVYKATAFGLKTCSKAYSHVALVDENSQGGTDVAVKMLKNHATMDQLKNLLNEVKLLNYIGCHVNIVNLLGACTVNLAKGELYMMVEYCCYGNLQQYLMKNRHRFARIDSSIERNKTSVVSKKKCASNTHLENTSLDTDTDHKGILLKVCNLI